jgi:hypothetical protein
VRNLFWPSVSDELSAKAVARRASKLIFGWAILCVAVGLFDYLVTFTLPSPPVGVSAATEFVWYILGMGLIFAIIAWRINKMSIFWSIGGFSICVLAAIATFPSPFGIILYAFLVLVFANAIRATSKHRRFVRIHS